MLMMLHHIYGGLCCFALLHEDVDAPSTVSLPYRGSWHLVRLLFPDEATLTNDDETWTKTDASPCCYTISDDFCAGLIHQASLSPPPTFHPYCLKTCPSVFNQIFPAGVVTAAIPWLTSLRHEGSSPPLLPDDALVVTSAGGSPVVMNE